MSIYKVPNMHNTFGINIFILADATAYDSIFSFQTELEIAFFLGKKQV